MTVTSVAAPTDLPTLSAPPTGQVADTLPVERYAELNALLAATEAEENRLPMAINSHGQWCTKGVAGWRPHPTYMSAYAAAHADEVA